MSRLIFSLISWEYGQDNCLGLKYEIENLYNENYMGKSFTMGDGHLLIFGNGTSNIVVARHKLTKENIQLLKLRVIPELRSIFVKKAHEYMNLERYKSFYQNRIIKYDREAIEKEIEKTYLDSGESEGVEKMMRCDDKEFAKRLRRYYPEIADKFKIFK